MFSHSSWQIQDIRANAIQERKQFLDFGKGEASLGFDETNKNVEDSLHSRSRGAQNTGVLYLFCVARALSRRAAFSFHVDTSIFSRDKTVLTMGKPEFNPTFFAFHNKNAAFMRF